MKYKLSLLLLVFFILFGYSQKDENVYDFFGGKSIGNEVIFFRLLFQIEDGKVLGYAFTDEQGKQETKSVINGTFNPRTKTIIFSETQKLLTRSKQSFSELCYLNGVISLEINPRMSIIKGVYTENTINGGKCNQGEIEIRSFDAYNRLIKTLAKEEKVKIKEEVEINIPKKKVLPTFKADKKITIIDNDEITIFWNSDKFTLDIWDDAIEDDDQITIEFNDEVILKKHTLKNKKESLEFDLIKGKNKLIFTANNTGFIANNTARVDLFDAKIKHQIVTKLKLNKSVTVYLIKQ